MSLNNFRAWSSMDEMIICFKKKNESKDQKNIKQPRNLHDYLSIFIAAILSKKSIHNDENRQTDQLQQLSQFHNLNPLTE